MPAILGNHSYAPQSLLVLAVASAGSVAAASDTVVASLEFPRAAFVLTSDKAVAASAAHVAAAAAHDYV